ncbi:FecCD family ABC transporter permease [Fusibacter ferrireducens]|uniref:Iron ABC transporter permease n=1 Tax=Fusibacter ferrireducens TaxID=2785058 RepID=A0ABR9ZPY0_9FIRM|nr:iron ABC transporter permease [Fusibacter ferrireducens]MBF4692376.1 iron ABC transporter permease [Fusibacter ferrireducens]
MTGGKTKKWSIMILIYISPVLLLLLSLALGRYPLNLIDVFQSTFFHKTSASSVETSVVWLIRFPRAIIGFLIGGSLALSGATLQGVFRNPLVDSGMLGVNSGAGFGAVLAIILFNQGSITTLIFSFAFGLLAVGMAFAIGGFYKQSSTIMLILGGVIVSSLFSALISFGKYIADPFDELPEIVFWLMGSLANVSYDELKFIWLPVLIGVPVILYYRRQINILSMGDKEATSLGVHTKRLKGILIISCSLITAASVCIAGTIGWVGLIIPHIIRMLIGNDHSKLMPLSFFLGGSFLVCIDILARSLTAAEIPIGILTSLIGAPFYILLLKKTKGGKW